MNCIFYSFPHPSEYRKERFMQWLRQIKCPDLFAMDPMEVYKKKLYAGGILERIVFLWRVKAKYYILSSPQNICQVIFNEKILLKINFKSEVLKG